MIECAKYLYTLGETVLLKMASKPKYPRGPKSGHENKSSPKHPPKATSRARVGTGSAKQNRTSDINASPSHGGSASRLKGASSKHKPSKQGKEFHARDDRGPQKKIPSVGRKDRSWEPRLHTLRNSEIVMLSQLQGDELVTKLSNSLKQFQQTLKHQETLGAPGIMDAILQIVLALTEVLSHRSGSDSGQKAGQILGEILSGRCDAFHFQLKQFVVNYTPHSTLSCRAKVPQVQPFGVERLCSVFKRLLIALPVSSWSCLPVDELFDAVKHLSTKNSAILVAETQEIVDLRNQIKQQSIPKKHDPSPVQNYQEWDNSEYRQIRILPNWEEICINDPPAKLRPNIVDGAYTDWMHYYDIQFRLLREDFIAPLRRGVCEYMQGVRGRKLKDVKVYHNVTIVAPVFTLAGVCYCLHFEVSHLKHCNWSHSKRLIFGSLVCLSPDNFQHITLFATIANRDPRMLARGRVEVLFEEGAAILDFCRKGTHFTMVESNAYFEASCHILHSLQTAEVDTMPFTTYLIEGECTSLSPPRYLADGRSAHYNLICLYGKESSSIQHPTSINTGLRGLRSTRPSSLSRHSLVNILDRSHWPDKGKLELDQSQLDAIHMALTQEIAVIQGPPGTGKTYIGLKIVEVLLNNRHMWDKSPILVMCFTNHALDQFLEGILKSSTFPHRDHTRYQQLGKACTHPKIVRIGGRSQSELIQPLNLSIVKKTVSLPWEVRKQLSTLKDLIKRSKSGILWKKLSRCYDNHSFIPLDDLYQWIDPDHYYQLHCQAQSMDEWDCALEIWLGLMEVVQIMPEKPEAISAQEEQSMAHLQLPEVAPIMVTLAQAEPQKHNQILRDYLHQQVQYLHPDSADIITDILLEDRDIQHVLEEPDLLKMKAQEIAEQLNSTTTASEEEKELIDIQGEAEIEEDSRLLEHEVEDFKQLTLTTSNKEPETFGSFMSGEETYYTNSTEVPEQQPTFAVQRVHNHERLLHRGRRQNPMTEAEASAVDDIHNLTPEHRWRLYNSWVAKHQEDLLDTNEIEFQKYNRLCREYKEASHQADRFALETADVIGMTTTGAAKYQHILHLVKPKIVIVEEAAEVLESHIVSALNAGSQHLILIGDHKQLRPKPNEYDLVKKYKLDISLFERLVRKGFPHATLQIQHRMRPEIAELVCPHIYDTLINHESVLRYENVKGICKNLFFINHNFRETGDQNLLSHSNPHESSYIPNLCKYLLQQGYEPSQITVLVTYTGQLMTMRKKMPKEDFDGIRVTTVDNYQGEENDIILLSLVRSNETGNIGFLKEANRVCVSLSRAKMGFYCIGNFTMLRDQADIWERIVAHIEKRGCLGEALPLGCCNHPETKWTAKLPEDFAKNAPLGGCTRNCEYRLQCGHVCTQKCHIRDSAHKAYKCMKPCVKTCTEGHLCKLHCYRECKPCTVPVLKIIPGCLHEQRIPCHQDPEQFKCMADCPKKCKNGHPCQRRCHQECGECSVKVDKAIIECGHTVTLACHMIPEQSLCTKLCEIKLLCGHNKTVECRKTLDIWTLTCEKPCEKILPCRHPCKKLCLEPCTERCEIEVHNKVWPCGHKFRKRKCYQAQQPEKYPCNKECEMELKCGHKYTKKCGEACIEKCIVLLKRKYPCGHINKVPCHSSSKSHPCHFKCAASSFLSCGHKCAGECPDCYITRIHKPCTYGINVSRFCGHTVSVQCLGLEDIHPGEMHCSANCAHRKCSHSCNTDCPPCNEPCGWACPHYQCTKLCHEVCDRPPCNERCLNRLPCGHQCIGICGEPCPNVCPQCEGRVFTKLLRGEKKFQKDQLYVQLGCDHIFTAEFMDNYMYQKPTRDILIGPKKCPALKCGMWVSSSFRYGNIVKQSLCDVEYVRKEVLSLQGGRQSEISDLKAIRVNFDSAVGKHMYIKSAVPSKDSVWNPHYSPQYKPYPQLTEAIVNIRSALASSQRINLEHGFLIGILITANEFLSIAHAHELYEVQPLVGLGDTVDKQVKTFIKVLVLLVEKWKGKLTVQVLEDLKSEQYRLALLLQYCAVKVADSKVPATQRLPNMAAQKHDTIFLAIQEQTEKFLHTLEANHSLRMTDTDYETHSMLLNARHKAACGTSIPFILKLVNQFPPLVKGQWYKCARGHYYCIPPTREAKSVPKCPNC